MVHEHLDEAMAKGQNVHRAFNYEICEAVDLLAVGIILERMEKLGLDSQESRMIKQAASALNCMFRQANDRLHNEPLSNLL